MSKLVSTLIAAAFAVTTFGAAAQTPPAKGDTKSAPDASKMTDTQKAEAKKKAEAKAAKMTDAQKAEAKKKAEAPK